MAKGVGQQTICEFWGARNLDSVEITERALRDAVRAAGATLVDVFVHRFAPHGISGIAIIAESHLAVHTWPELGYCAADFFTCGDGVDMHAIVKVLRDAYDAERADVRDLVRGVPPEEYAARHFVESDPGSPLRRSFDVTRVLEQRRTRCQDLMLFESPGVGKVLALDGVVHCTDLDSFGYLELMAHPVMHTHPSPREVLVIGGGDLQLAREVLRHDAVERVTVLESDEEIVRIAEKHFDAARIALADPRTDIVVGEPRETLARFAASADIVLADVTQPLGTAARRASVTPTIDALWETLRDDGVLVAQAGSVHLHGESLRATWEAIASRAAHTELLWSAQATDDGGWWTFVCGSRTHDPLVVRRTQPGLETRLYTPDAHTWFFVPPVVRERLLAGMPTA